MKSKEEIKQLAFKEYLKNNIEIGSFIQGYTQCQEDMADKNYTEDDIYMALEFGRSHSSMTDKQFIESLNKQD